MGSPRRGGALNVLQPNLSHIRDWEGSTGMKKESTGTQEGTSGSASSNPRHSSADCTSRSLPDLPGRGPEAREGGQPILVSCSFIFCLRISSSWSCRSLETVFARSDKADQVFSPSIRGKRWLAGA